MTRLVLLQAPLGVIDRVHVRVGEHEIESAANLTSAQAALLADDDRSAIMKAMIK